MVTFMLHAAIVAAYGYLLAGLLLLPLLIGFAFVGARVRVHTLATVWGWLACALVAAALAVSLL